MPWISVNDRLPKRIESRASGDVLVWPRGEDMPPTAYYDHRDKRWCDASGFRIDGITHWAELPPGPPEDQT